MVLDNERIKYKKVLGYRYTTKVISFLEKKGLINSNGKMFSASHIRNVMNGKVSHQIIEDAILKVYKIELKKQQNKKSLLSS